MMLDRWYSVLRFESLTFSFSNHTFNHLASLCTVTLVFQQFPVHGRPEPWRFLGCS